MEPINRSAQVVRFGTFEADFRAAELRRNGVRVRLQQQPLRILELLIERPGEIVTREELRQRLWSADVFVAFDQSLNNAIKKLRAALGDPAENPHFIETVARQGYRFIAPVERMAIPQTTPAQPIRPRKTRQSIWIGVGSVALVVVAFVAAYRFRLAGHSSESRVTLAVLPFENLSGDPAQEYFSDGLTEEMITQLAAVNPRDLGVLARTSALQYKRTRKGAGEIGRELHVDYLVEGSVRREDQRVRITAQVIRTSDQMHTWAKSYVRDVRDILALQHEVARDIANEVNVSVRRAASRRRSADAALNPSAYEAYIQGRYFWNKRTRDDLTKAIDYFQSALRDQPQYAEAYGGLADCWNALAWYGYVPAKDAFPRAMDAARRALAIDDSLAAAHTSLAFVRFNYEWDWGEAERGFQRAIELDSDYPIAHHWYGDYLSAIGRHEEAIAASTRARRLDPVSPIINAWLGWRRYFARDYDAAVDQYRRALELDPNFAPTHLVLGQAYEQQGRLAEAVAELQHAEQLARGGPLYVAALAHALAGAGRRGDAERQLQRMIDASPAQYVPPVQIAIALAGVGRTPQALAWLEKGVEERSAGMVWIKVDPRFDALRREPRFSAIVKRLRFP